MPELDSVKIKWKHFERKMLGNTGFNRGTSYHLEQTWQNTLLILVRSGQVHQLWKFRTSSAFLVLQHALLYLRCCNISNYFPCAPWSPRKIYLTHKNKTNYIFVVSKKAGKKTSLYGFDCSENASFKLSIRSEHW